MDGILLAKDLLRYFALERKRDFDLRDAMRPAWFVPESKRLNVLLKEFQNGRNHMAIVVNEWGGLAGLVTIEDVLEQIVGKIDDEHDIDEESFLEQVKPGEFVVKALMPVEDFNAEFDTAFDEDEFDTVGGIVVKAFGYLPERGEELTLGDLRFSVLRADQRRVHLLRVLAGGSTDATEKAREAAPRIGGMGCAAGSAAGSTAGSAGLLPAYSRPLVGLGPSAGWKPALPGWPTPKAAYSQGGLNLSRNCRPGRSAIEPR